MKPGVFQTPLQDEKFINQEGLNISEMIDLYSE